MWLDRFQNEDPGREFWVFKMPEFENMNRFTLCKIRLFLAILGNNSHFGGTYLTACRAKTPSLVEVNP